MKKALFLSALCGLALLTTGCVAVHEQPPPQPTTTRTVTTESHSVRAAY